MVQFRPLPVLLLTAVALAGCGGDGGGDDATTTTTTPGTMTNTTTGPGPGEMEPIVIEGTVTGFADCTLASQGQPPASADQQTVAQAAWNGTYTFEATTDSPAADFCISWGDDATFGAPVPSGTVPDAVSRVRVASDLNPVGATYTITIIPMQ